MSDEAKPTHTPEPWKTDDNFPAFVVIPNGNTICNCCWTSPVEDASNAARIVACVNAMANIADPSAVPELIAALEAMTNTAYTITDIERARAVLAKIKGVKS